MKKRLRSPFLFSLIFIFGMATFALPITGEEIPEKKETVKEYRLGEITIKGEKEKPQVYFIIPKAKFSLQNITIYDDIIWNIKETEIQPEHNSKERSFDK